MNENNYEIREEDKESYEKWKEINSFDQFNFLYGLLEGVAPEDLKKYVVECNRNEKSFSLVNRIDKTDVIPFTKSENANAWSSLMGALKVALKQRKDWTEDTFFELLDFYNSEMKGVTVEDRVEEE